MPSRLSGWSSADAPRAHAGDMKRPSKIIAAIDELEATRGLLVKAGARLLQMEAVLKRNQFGCGCDLHSGHSCGHRSGLQC